MKFVVIILLVGYGSFFVTKIIYTKDKDIQLEVYKKTVSVAIVKMNNIYRESTKSTRLLNS